MKLREFLIRYRAMTGTLCLVFVLFFATPTAFSIFLGFIFVMAGVFFRGWAAGHILKDQELATKGPYSIMRNPLYFGSFLIGLGIAIAADHLYGWIITLSYIMFFYTFLMIVEHKRLLKLFGDEYREWSRNTGIFFPKLHKIRENAFDIALYVKNREYRVFIFSLFVVLVLILKFFLTISKKG
jgi:protein-S-isoprenylcysteine O-methyltransferase Ste14